MSVSVASQLTALLGGAALGVGVGLRSAAAAFVHPVKVSSAGAPVLIEYARSAPVLRQALIFSDKYSVGTQTLSDEIAELAEFEAAKEDHVNRTDIPGLCLPDG